MLILILIFFLGEWHEQTKTKMYYTFLSGHSVYKSS